MRNGKRSDSSSSEGHLGIVRLAECFKRLLSCDSTQNYLSFNLADIAEIHGLVHFY